MSDAHLFDVGNQLPSIEGSRVRLRWLREDDVPALYRIFSDPDVVRYWSSPALEDYEGAYQLLNEIRTLFAEGTLYQWGLVNMDDDEVIGTCTLAALSVVNRKAEIGFAMAKASWGRGLMTEALPLLLEFGFERLALHRLEAESDPRNARSLALLERLGFVREGCRRQSSYQNDEWQDAVIFGLLREDWKKR